jgi:methionine-gamma-lyase
METDKTHFETRTIHGGTPVAGDADKALSPPIHMSSTFTFDSLADAEKVMDFASEDYVYTRGNNPTLRLFEQRMSELEEGTSAVAFSSGMAAIASVLLALARKGDTVLIHKTLYGSSYTLATELLPKYGITTEICDLSDAGTAEETIGRLKPEVIFFETPCNPDLILIDIRQVCRNAEQCGASVVVDNTFATPYLQNPLKLGADVSVHSATKYICGHGDAVGGVAVFTDSDLAARVKFGYMCELGGVMSPFNAWLMLRGLKTLHVRMERHCSNAQQVAEYLEQHPKVNKVFYPKTTGQGEQMRGFGGVVSFTVTGGMDAARRCLDGFSMAKIAVSLGDCETLVQLPAAMTHRGYDREALIQFGLSEDLIRISVGIEHIEEIIKDVGQALDQV